MAKALPVLIVAVAVGLIGYAVTRPSEDAATRARFDPALNAAAKAQWAQSDHRDQTSHINIKSWNWHKAGFDNVMIATFTLSNANEFAVKDIAIVCEHSAPSGTRIDASSRTVYEAIPAKGTKTIKNFNMGLIHSQAASSSCRVSDFAKG